MHVEFLVDVLHMGLYGAVRYEQFAFDVGRLLPLRKQQKNLLFALRERRSFREFLALYSALRQ